MKRSPNQPPLKNPKTIQTLKPDYHMSNSPLPLYSNTTVLRKRASQMDTGKQQNIITNLRSQLTNLKQQVAKLMNKEPEPQKNKNPNPNNLNGNLSFLNYGRPESVDGRSRQAPSEKHRPQVHPTKVSHENQKFSTQLKSAYSRQKQLLKERAGLIQALSKQKSKNELEKDIAILKRSYMEQIQQLKALQSHLEQQVETKNKILENERHRSSNLQSELMQKINEANNEIGGKNRELSEMRKQLLEQKRKRIPSQDINKAEPDYTQLNKLKQKLGLSQQKNDSLSRRVKEVQETNQEKDKQIRYLESVLQSQMNEQERKISNLKKQNSTLASQVAELKQQNTTFKEQQTRAKTSENSSNEKLVEKQRKQKQQLKQHYELKIKQLHNTVEDVNKNLKQNQLLLLNINSHAGKKKQEDETTKVELKNKEKTINNLINDVKHLEHEMRLYGFNKNLNKAMTEYIAESNQMLIKHHLSDLNEKYREVN